MIWIDKITDLQYYKQPKGVPCFCEQLVYSSDMILQGSFPKGNGNYTIKLYVVSADGTTQYEDATNYFDVYFAASNATNQHFFNARLKQFTPAMCAHECFIIQAVVTASSGWMSTNVFNKFTERYCQSECCDTAQGITFSQSSFVGSAEIGPAEREKQVGQCGEPMIRIVSKHNCYNIFSDEHYGIPDVILSGNANFAYTKITSCKGRIIRRPRTISRTLSYNCKLQKVESTPQYLLECFEFFPPWKMYEIEAQFHAKEIYIDDYETYKQYQLPEGQVFKQVSKCFELFKLEAVLEGCEQRQIHGCDLPCKGSGGYAGFQQVFVVPEDYNGGVFFDEYKQVVAEDVTGLVDYFRTLNGMTAAATIDTSSVCDTLHAAIGLSGEGYIPTSIYYDSTAQSNRLYSFYADTLDDICSRAVVGCVRPIVGNVIVVESSCVDPEIGYPTVSSITPEVIDITPYGDWTIDVADTSLTVYNGQATLSISVKNTTIIPTGVPDDDATIFNHEVIGVISGSGRPENITILNYSNNNLTSEQALSIDEQGYIRYYGEPTLYDTGVGVEIKFSNLVYNL